MSVLRTVIYNRPHEVEFLGWKSTTVELFQDGWIADCDMFTRPQDIGLECRWVFRHANVNTVLIGTQIIGDATGDMYFRGQIQPIIIRAAYDGNHRITTPTPNMEWGELSAVDLQPRMVNLEVKTLNDLLPFRSAASNNEVFFEEKSVADLLKVITKKQMPKQDEIRKRLAQEKQREALFSDLSTGKPMLTVVSL